MHFGNYAHIKTRSLFQISYNFRVFFISDCKRGSGQARNLARLIDTFKRVACRSNINENCWLCKSHHIRPILFAIYEEYSHLLKGITSNSLQLITGYTEDDDVTRLVNTYDFYILPVMNPDGYEYQWNTVSPPTLFRILMLHVNFYCLWFVYLIIIIKIHIDSGLGRTKHHTKQISCIINIEQLEKYTNIFAQYCSFEIHFSGYFVEKVTNHQQWDWLCRCRSE